MLTLELIKLHCRIDSNTEDALLQHYLDAAINFIESQLNRKLYQESVPEDESNGLKINKPIEQALLMTIGHWYEHRESVILGNISSKEIEQGVWRLIQPYRILGV